MTEYITSRHNPFVAHVRKLAANRAYRRKSGQCLLDGVKLYEEALKWGGQVTDVVTVRGENPPQLPDGVRHIEVPGELMEYISPMEAPQGLLFLCRMFEFAPPERLEGERYLVLDGVQDPGNLGTIWRTADAFGCHGVFLIHHCCSPCSPKALRASMGACFRLPVWEEEWEGLLCLFEQAGIPLYAAALGENTQDLRKLSLERAGVVIGSEGRGVSQTVLEGCKTSLKIPMTGRCESLNAAIAAGVVLWEMGRGAL